MFYLTGKNSTQSIKIIYIIDLPIKLKISEPIYANVVVSSKVSPPPIRTEVQQRTVCFTLSDVIGDKQLPYVFHALLCAVFIICDSV